jgi:hypothetical protein
MHHFYTMLALDLANERALEAQRHHQARRLLAGVPDRSGIRRRLTDAVNGIRSMIDGAAPTERRAQPRLPASHSH